MRKLLLPMLVSLFLISCSSKKWDKGTVSAKCKKEMSTQAKASPLLTEPKVAEICDCIADKMVTKYKSEAEADKNTSEATQIGKDCAMAVLMPGK